jgi:hypothetical protein
LPNLGCCYSKIHFDYASRVIPLVDLLQFSVAGVLDDSWKVLSSPVVPQGKMLVVLKPEIQIMQCLLCTYRPLTITPFPLGRKPVMTFLSRYAAKFIRHEVWHYEIDDINVPATHK